MAAAAALNAFQQYLRNTLGLTASIVNAIEQQGLSDFPDFLDLKDTDIDKVAENVRKPGGVVPNPNPGRGRPPTIPNPGVQLGHILVIKLKKLRYYIDHLRRTQRLPFDDQVATLDMISNVYKLKECDETEDNLSLPLPLTKIENARVVIESMDDYLKRCTENTLPRCFIPEMNSSTRRCTFGNSILRRFQS